MAKIEITQPPSGGGTVNEGVLQIQGGGPITNSSQLMTDQSGNASPLYISSTSLTITTPTSLTANTRVIIQGSTDSAGYILRAVNRTGSEIFNIKDDGSILSLGPVTISTIANATTDTDKFLVSDSGVIKYRTGAELLSDIGAQAALTNPVTGTGAATRVAFWSSGSAISSSNALNWDNTNGYLGINTASPVAQFQVRGNAVAGNNVARFETQGLVNLFTLSEEGKITAFAPQINALSGTTEINKFTSSFAASSAGSGSFRPLSIAYTINNVAGQTGTATGIFLSATATALGGMTHNLIDMQLGAVSVFKVNQYGACGTYFLDLAGNNQNKGLYMPAGSNASILSNFNSVQLQAYDGIAYVTGLFMSGGGVGEIRTNIGPVAAVASARLQVDSTTKGFLPPRMTTLQRDAILTPAAGLVVYDTTLGKLAVRTGFGWETVTSV